MTRLTHAWRELERQQRLAALAALGLFVSMFLPWYSKADTFVEHGSVKASQTSLSAFQAFSFVEAAVLLVSAGVLAMLFARAEQHDFQLPGGDGLVVMVAGAWAALLVFYRLLDKPGLQASQRITATVGVEWGIFIALLLALGLLYAGRLMRSEERPDPSPVRRRARPAPSAPPDDRDRWAEPPTGETVVARRRATGERADAQRTQAERSERADAERPQAERSERADAERATVDAGGATAGRPARAARPIPARPPADSKPKPAEEAATELTRAPGAGSGRRPTSSRPRYPPGPSEQMSFEDPPSSAGGER